jgi:hypothetical protein
VTVQDGSCSRQQQLLRTTAVQDPRSSRQHFHKTVAVYDGSCSRQQQLRTTPGKNNSRSVQEQVAKPFRTSSVKDNER